MNAQKAKKEQEKLKESMKDKMNFVFKQIDEDYKHMLKDVEAEEIAKQRKELENYQKELDTKLEQEKKVRLPLKLDEIYLFIQ